MTMWCPDLSRHAGPAYCAIADAVGAAVASGRLAPGDRLPPQRDLAYRLGLSLNTVTRGYAEAIRRGYLDGAVGRGTYVRTPPADRPAAEGARAALIRPVAGPIDFANNLPFRGSAADALARTLAGLAADTALGALLDHKPDVALDRHAEAGRRWIATLGLDGSGRRVVLTSGAQHGLLVTLLALTRPGDAILVEELTYPPLLAIARRLGLHVFPVALDGEGVAPAALDELCRTTAARVLCCTPTLQTPTAVTMGAERRRAIADLAERHRLTVVEDDVFGFLPAARPAPLAAYAPDRTVLVASTSKSLAPGLRVGYLHAPERLEAALRSAVALSSWMPPPLMAEVATRWIEDGTAERLNAEQRAEARHRREMARAMLAGGVPAGSPDGFHLWLPLPDPWSPDGFEAAARRLGVEVRGGPRFAVDAQARPAAVRLCLSHEIDRERVETGLRTIARLLDGGYDADAFLV